MGQRFTTNCHLIPLFAINLPYLITPKSNENVFLNNSKRHNLNFKMRLKKNFKYTKNIRNKLKN